MDKRRTEIHLRVARPHSKQNYQTYKLQSMHQNSNQPSMDRVYKTFYIIGDRIVESTEALTEYDYRVQASTIDGARKFLKMVQDARRRNPDFKF